MTDLADRLAAQAEDIRQRLDVLYRELYLIRRGKHHGYAHECTLELERKVRELQFCLSTIEKGLAERDRKE